MTAYILIAITAWVFTNILLDSDMILGKYGKWLHLLPTWISKPLGLCEYCLGGQLALWHFLYYHWHEYDITHHIMMICLTIFVIELINIITTKLR